MIPTQSCPRCGGPLTTRLCPKCGPIGAPWQHDSRRKAHARWILRNFLFVILAAVSLFVTLSYLGFVRQNRWSLAHPPAVRRDSPVVSLDQLHGSGRIYLAQMGPHKAPYSLDKLAEWLRAKYHLDVQILPPMKLDHAAWNASRGQYVAEMLYEQLKREHPDLAADPNAYLIGFTDEDMFSVEHEWKFSHTQRDMKRAAVISAARLQDSFFERIGVNANVPVENLEARLRRFLLKDIALLYWHLPVNENPSSLLQRFLPPDLPTEDIYVSDLEPTSKKWGRAEGEPCVVLRYSHQDGIRPLSGELIRSCSDEKYPLPDDSEETFEFSLRYGLLVDRHTDFYLPDSAPIEFERATRDGWKGPMGFGMSGSHNYDKFLGSDDNMLTTDIIRGDGSRYVLRRIPKWLPAFALLKEPALGFVKYVDTDFSGNYYEMRWHLTPVENFSLTRYDGETETYLPCDDRVRCYETSCRNRDGKELIFQRDQQRRLTRLTSPAGQWISLSYGPTNHITEITDSRGRAVRYGYDDRNRLVSVTYPSGEVYSYTYDDSQRLLTFSVATDANSMPQLLLRNYYRGGRLTKQELAGNRVYHYTYDPPDANADDIDSALVNTSGGATFKVRFEGDMSTIWELPSLSHPDATGEPAN